MKNIQTLMSIDCGTQSLRVLIYSPSGEQLFCEKINYTPYFSVKPGYAEQNPDVWWKSLCIAVQKAKQTVPELFMNLRGVTVTTQRDTVLVVDTEGNAIRPAILWLDNRKVNPPYIPHGTERLLLKLVHMEEAVYKTQEAGKTNWIRYYEPEVWDKTYKVLLLSGYLTKKLCGEFVDSVASQIGHIPFDYKKQCWASSSHRTMKMFPIEPEKLPKLVKPGSVIGTIQQQASIETGLPYGLPVVASGSDKGCETIGMGVLDETMVSLSFGTTATVQTTSKHYREPIRFMPSYPAALPDFFNPEVEIFRGYWMITWFKNQFAYNEVLEAESNGTSPEVILNKHLSNTSPGSFGLMMHPFWTAGLENPSLKGALIGFGDIHERSHVYRAIIEGLAYGLREGIESIERVSGKTVTIAAASGGASQADEICQITADILNKPIVRGATPEASGLGAAMCCAAGIGWYDSVHDAVRAMKHHAVYFEPQKQYVDLYNNLYAKVYKKMSSTLLPLYEAIREIVNYPEKINYTRLWR
ncbi:MAG TPA: FGGY-family carbohydrate kinase [Spirochaetales bacterium]|nr:FGGY-family carbohydrate kinase [Spirochaetales bacterium]HRV28016.1 FGGY-family carbohydrate kinase [Spirochaetia bacterium]